MAKEISEKNANPKVFLHEGEFDLPELEEKVLTFWDERHIFEKSIEKESGAPKFIFYEGPPYANGKPAIHHVISRIVKDVILRYKTMQGFEVPRRAGWDTHGLPVEIATEKALGLKSKKDIEELGVKLFNEKAMEQVWIYKDEWERMTRRIGYWLDFKNAYVTYEPEYIESIWWTLSQIHKRGLLYKGFKVVPWCTRDGTSLSSHELAQGYKEVSDTSVYVKFKLKAGQKIGDHVIAPDDKVYILSWTTTPWTLPGNVALAVGADIAYRAFEHEGEYLIAAVDRLNDLGFSGAEKSYDLSGSQLVGLEYEPLFDIAPLRSERSYKVYPAGFVTTTDGTGVVHTAVMYGEDDYALGKQVGLPEYHTVDEAGKFTKEVAGLAGQYVKSKETEEHIFDHLRENGNLLRTEPYVHEYPFCWRCGTAILYYARSSWFIEMSKLREKLLENNETVNWTPKHVKTGRFGEWLREVKDWNLSRERYWGAPLPIWECKECGHTEVVDGLDELDRLAGGSRNNYWAMRHGESENIIFKIVDSGDQNSHLTPNGKEQVVEAAKGLKKDKIDLVFASDLLRTKESAEIIASELGIPVHFDKRLREVNFGGLSGKPSIEIGKIFPTLESRFAGRVDEKSESYRDVRTRAWNFLEETEAKHHGKNILIVSHEDTIWMLAQAALGWSEKQAAEKKEEGGGMFIKPAEVMPFGVKKIPRNDTGVVDVHRPFADDISPPCPKCAATMARVPEVADVWYDSGAMPYAQAHYPFSVPKTDVATLSGLDYPADYISEGMDQTRGWFYTLFAIAAALGYGAPYKNVIALGLINDKFGQKMSKSKGNIVEPFAVIDKYGVDALRWYFFTGSPLGEPKNFDEAEVAKAFRRVHLIVYNSFIFWKTYADQKAKLSDGPTNVLDEWINARLDQVNAEVSKKLDAYEIREAAIEIETLVDDLSRWYIRRSRRRLQRPVSDADYRAASATLGHVLLSLITLMAPFTPFFSELFYGPLGGTKESVHLDEWPKPLRTDRAAEEGAAIVSQMAAVRAAAAAGLALRAEKGIKVRQPLASMTVGVKLEKEIAEILAEEMNVKEIRFAAALGGNVELDTTITPALREEGLLREVARMFQELRQKAGLQPKDKIVAMMELPEKMMQVIDRHEAPLLKDIGATEVDFGRSEKFLAEEITKLEGDDVWVAVRKA
ncbi:MAG TPA: class I tRNA ligase family protein [Candidatus Paceibacterota bacterium]|nr:class I tRNA ligase family protein [Candidatus Paceibacterota bacterium]